MCGIDEEDLDLLCTEMAIGGVGPAFTDDYFARDAQLRVELGQRFGVTNISYMHHWNGAVCRAFCWRDRENVTEMVEAWHGGPLT